MTPEQKAQQIFDQLPDRMYGPKFIELMSQALREFRELGNCGHCCCPCASCGGCNGQANAKSDS